jgi:hypothetical protein
MEQNETLANIASQLPALQNVLNILHDKEAVRLNKVTTETQCVVSLNDPAVMNARIEAGSVPVIRINAIWALSCLAEGKGDNVVDAIRRGIIIAHKRLRWTLGKSKPRIAAEYIEKARAYRAVAGKDFTLPVQSFKTTVSLTMTDAMTGETETEHNIPVSRIEEVQRAMAARLTAKVYAHEEAATLLDTLEGHKLAAQEPEQVVAVDLEVNSPAFSVQTLAYEVTL